MKTFMKIDLDAEEPQSTADGVTIHDLFNELHQRLCVGYEDLTGEIASKVDELHHDYTDLTT